MTLSLNGETIPNDGYVLASAIGTRSSSLRCNTNRSGCCRASDASDRVAQGHWYLPDGTRVESFSQEVASDRTRNFFSRDRLTGVVRLHRYGDPSERGRFRCEVPSADGDMVTMYVNIGEWFVSSSTVTFYKLIILCTIIVDWIPPPTTAWPSITTTSQLLTSEPMHRNTDCYY